MAKTGFFQENTVVEETGTSLSETTSSAASNDDKPKSSFYARNQEYEEVANGSGFLTAAEEAAADAAASEAAAAASAAAAAASAASISGSYLQNVVEDLTPQLGGDLDLNNFSLFDSSLSTPITIGFDDQTVFVNTLNNATSGSYLYLHQESTTPAANDTVGIVRFSGRNSADAFVDGYTNIYGSIVDPTAASEDGKLEFDVLSGGANLLALTLDGVNGHSFTAPTGKDININVSGASIWINGANGYLGFYDGGYIQNANFSYASSLEMTWEATQPTNGDTIGTIWFNALDSTSVKTDYASINAVAADKTNGSEDGTIDFSVKSIGGMGKALSLRPSTYGTTVNYVTINGDIVDQQPVIGVAGTDTNIGMSFAVKGDPTLSPWYFSYIFDLGPGDSSSLALYNYGASAGPTIQLMADVNGANDVLGGWSWGARNSANARFYYGGFDSVIVDGTAGSEDSKFRVTIKSAGADLTTLNVEPTQTFISNNLGGGGFYTYVGSPGFEFYEEDSYPLVQLSSYRSVPADGDIAGHIAFLGWHDGGVPDWFNAGQIKVTSTDITDGTEDSKMELSVQSGGADLTALTLGGGNTYNGDYAHTLDFGAQASAFVLKNSNAGNEGPKQFFIQNSASPANADYIAQDYYIANNNAAALTIFGSMNVNINDVTAGSEDTYIQWYLMTAGVSNTPIFSLQAPGYGTGPLFDFGTTDSGTVTIQNSASSSGGPGLYTYHNSASPAASDAVTFWDAYGKTNLGNDNFYGGLEWQIVDPTDASTDSSFDIRILYAGSQLFALTLGTTNVEGTPSHNFDVAPVSGASVQIGSTSADNFGPTLNYYHNSASPADGDFVATEQYYAKDDAANPTYYGLMNVIASDVSNGTEDGSIVWTIPSAGADAVVLTLDSSGITTNANPFTGLYAIATSAAGFGPTLTLEQVSASPAADDAPGWVQFFGRDSGGVDVVQYGLIGSYISSPTNGTEESRLVFDTIYNGNIELPLVLGTDTNARTAFGSIFDGGNNDEGGSIELTNQFTGASGPKLTFFHNSASPAANDDPGGVYFYGKDSAANIQFYGSMIPKILDTTSTSEDSKTLFEVMRAGASVEALTLGTTGVEGHWAHVFDLGTGESAVSLDIESTDTGTGGPAFNIYLNSASPADNDNLGYIQWWGKTDTAVPVFYSYMYSMSADVTVGTEDGPIIFSPKVAGADRTGLSIGDGVVVGENLNYPGTGKLAADAIELGNDTDTSLTRAAAGQVAVEGDNLLRATADLAAQADMETGSSTTKWVAPGRQHFHQSAAKCWGFTTGGGAPSLNAQSYNMTSITDTNTGRLTVTIATDFSSTSYVVTFGGTTTNSTTAAKIIMVNTKAAGSFEIDSYSAVTPTLSDIIVGFDWCCFGDL